MLKPSNHVSIAAAVVACETLSGKEFFSQSKFTANYNTS